MMPSHVRAFWWLSVATVACWAYSPFSHIWHVMLFPSAEQLAMAVRMAKRNPGAQRIVDFEMIAIPLTLCAATLFFAWLAAFRCKGWARWFAAVLLLHNQIAQILILFMFAGAHYDRPVLELEVNWFWANPLGYVLPTLAFVAALAAIAFVFSGNAQAWFRRSSPGAFET